MNAAFALGRLCDMDLGPPRLLALPEATSMVRGLVLFPSNPQGIVRDSMGK